MFLWKVKYTIEPASWHIYEREYFCEAWTRYGAWKKWLENTKDEKFYECYEYRNTYRSKKQDIEYIKPVWK